MAALANTETLLNQACGEYGERKWAPPPCQEGCPVGTDIPSYLTLAWQGKYREAFEVIQSTNPFSSVCGRVCAKPCEIQCRRDDNDAAVAIREVKRFVTDRAGHDFDLPEAKVTQTKTIGIVGGGPAGLTAAQDLAEAGYEVHIYEKRGQLGGMMEAGIPTYRLPRKLLREDIDRILQHCPGITVHLNCALGEHVALDELKSRHDAVLLAIGLWKDRKLGVPGELEGLRGLHGIDFLIQANEGEALKLPAKVIVVGGGNVAMDTARTALRSGATEVELFCLESRDEMPAWGDEIEAAEVEGVSVNPGWGPTQILHEDGKVVGVEFMRCVSVFDKEERFNPTFDPQRTKAVPCDALLVSIGQMAENPWVDGESQLWAGAYVKASFETMRTADPKVFAAGDGAFGPSAIVHAMAHGHRASYYILAYLKGDEPAPYELSYQNRQLPVAQDDRWELLPREQGKFLGLGSKCDLLSESEETLNEDAVRDQAARCLRCDAETGTANYSRRTRDHINAMSRTMPGNTQKLKQLWHSRLRVRENPYPEDCPASIDDIVFMAAAMTRLIIDPYREACELTTRLGGQIGLKAPFLFAGFDDAPKVVRHALGRAVKAVGCAYIGRRPLPDCEDSPWFLLHGDGDSCPDGSTPSGIIYLSQERLKEDGLSRQGSGQLLGLVVTSSTLADGLAFALENDLDLLVLDGSLGMDQSGNEAEGPFDLTVVRDAIQTLREQKKEEQISLLYFGGLRTGTDVAKMLAMNCTAGVFGAALGLAMGGRVGDGQIEFEDSLSFDGQVTEEQFEVQIEERTAAAVNWIKACIQEVALIPRCLGKTNVHNLEVEDIRSITVNTSKAMGVPLASGYAIRT
jgi:NADPH-dependent glutamate synthase beta subunit-like oxidoreductase